MKIFAFKYVGLIVAVWLGVNNTRLYAAEDIAQRASNFVLTEANLIINKAKSCKNETQFIEFLKEEVKSTVAINYMALWVLGNNKSKFSSEQFNRFVTAFHNHLTEFYGSILYENKDNAFQLKNSRSVAANKATVEFVLPLHSQTILINWQVRLDPKSNKLLITDVIVNGISFLQAKRTEYNALFKQSNEDPEQFLQIFTNKTTIQTTNK